MAMLSTSVLRGVDEIGPYQIVQDLGPAPFGTAFLAVDSRSGRQAVLKVIPPSRPGFALEQDGIPWEILLQETRALFRIYHRGIPALYEIAEHEGSLLVAMEPVEGLTLHEVLETGDRPDRALLVDWGCQLLDILAEAHGQGILHRHIGEDQIVIAPEGHLVLTGFGLTQIFFDPLTTFPPQHTIAEPSSIQSDLLAVGLLLHRLAFASGLKGGGNQRRDPVLKVLARATYPDPAARYQDAAEMAEALRHAGRAGEALSMARRKEPAGPAGHLAVVPRPPAPLPVRNGARQDGESESHDERRFALLLVATALLLMLSVIAAGWLLIGNDAAPATGNLIPPAGAEAPRAASSY